VSIYYVKGIDQSCDHEFVIASSIVDGNNKVHEKYSLQTLLLTWLFKFIFTK